MINYSYFAVNDKECMLHWNGHMIEDVESETISELRRTLKDRGYSQAEYCIVTCASCDIGDTTYYGYGFSKGEARDSLNSQL